MNNMNKLLLILGFFVVFLNACTKDKDTSIPTTPRVVDSSLYLIHYWNFNDTNNLIVPKISLVAGSNISIDYNTSVGVGYTDSTSSTATANLRKGDSTGLCLRVRNPVNSMTIAVPTTGYKNIILNFEADRTSKGPQTDSIYYSVDQGRTFTNAGITNNAFLPQVDPTYTLYTFNFSAISAVNNNPKFLIKIVFSNGNLNATGNDRFDNITLEGKPF